MQGIVCHAEEVLVCYLVTKKLVVQVHGRDATQGPSLQLLSILRIHGQHGNTVYKGGLKQESEQCLTTTVTNSSEMTLDMC